MTEDAKPDEKATQKKPEQPAAATTAPVTPKPTHPKYGWLSLTIAAIFGLFYAYDVWEAVGNLIGVPKIYDGFGLTAQTPWVLLIAALVIPMIVYGVALLVGLRRNVGERALVLLTGLAVSNALALGTIGANSLIFSDLLHRI